jgi:hypothetical protein
MSCVQSQLTKNMNPTEAIEIMRREIIELRAEIQQLREKVDKKTRVRASSDETETAKPETVEAESIHVLNNYPAAAADKVYITYVPKEHSRMEHYPIVSVNVATFIELLGKLKKSSRIFTLSGKQFETITTHHSRQTGSGWMVETVADV